MLRDTFCAPRPPPPTNGNQLSLEGSLKRTLAFPLLALAIVTLVGRRSAGFAVPAPGANWLSYTNNACGFQFPCPGGKTIPGAADTFALIELPITPRTNLSG